MRSRRRNVIAVLSGDQPGEATPMRRRPLLDEPSDDTPEALAKRGEDSDPTSRPDHITDDMAQPRKSKKPRRKSTITVTGEHTFDIDDKPDFRKRLRRVLFRPKALAVVALMLFGVTVGPMIPGWLPDPAEREEYQLETESIVITPPTHDVPPDLLKQVIQRSKLPKTVSLLNDDLTGGIAKAFAAHPWVAEVVSVRKSFPPHVEVELVYRKPIAMIETKAGMYPVDAKSVLLPPEDFSMSDTRRYPVIRGVTSKPQGPAGFAWGDHAVAAAVQLAEVLQRHWDELSLAAIVVPSEKSSADDLKFDLLTRGGSRILWGRAPGTSHPGELTAEQKVGRLKKYLADFGRFDQPHGPYEIDIRHWQEITRRPISAASRKATGEFRRR